MDDVGIGDDSGGRDAGWGAGRTGCAPGPRDGGSNDCGARSGAGSWTSFGNLSDSTALVLADADFVRFVPDGANATTASLTYRAWDGTGAAAGATVDASLTGNATPFSSAFSAKRG